MRHLSSVNSGRFFKSVRLGDTFTAGIGYNTVSLLAEKAAVRVKTIAPGVFQVYVKSYRENFAKGKKII